jgi:hypothetical protein
MFYYNLFTAKGNFHIHQLCQNHIIYLEFRMVKIFLSSTAQPRCCHHHHLLVRRWQIQGYQLCCDPFMLL